ncbi:MAG: hypothetical protein HYW78_03970 [Parcubacteria group bacterium]|nr:hypothetical protein [Parcubacteria group bacterium]
MKNLFYNLSFIFAFFVILNGCTKQDTTGDKQTASKQENITPVYTIKEVVPQKIFSIQIIDFKSIRTGEPKAYKTFNPTSVIGKGIEEISEQYDIQRIDLIQGNSFGTTITVGAIVFVTPK